MKKLIYLLGVLFIAVNVSSCNPESLIDNNELQGCCDQEGDLQPPPPPPPPPGNGG
ncbi:hypothetical protein [Winogradskyella sp.]|uniref:hypothetical protein n=1 Tax=Winogradskyella sp. TaxID=1883156 RepID=UPI003BABFC6A